ncbi:hypothetical protein [Hydrocarboniclastica marina]|uniref:Uncharacterized protein n=1 Tax=Hydrocarboniclastica marina TaxID=2259620 RepID=A0A4P7XHL5_9ALTE|nr:hypothetical protein [Hydrocarboniclastica marina]MAL98026.1 hypothetical protein [Alteromonadaceae bacterium]QCF26538.1 hypothetical protein soil367_11665 [Hydrocarboniclastica marina]
MQYQCSQTSDVLKEALIIAWTIEHFKNAKVTLELTCSDGQTATITETMEALDTKTDISGSSIQSSPGLSAAADQLGDIKTDTWF